MRHEKTLLHAIGALLRDNPESELSAERVNGVGAALGLSESEVYDVAGELERQGLVQFRRTRLGLTVQGKSRLSIPSRAEGVSQQGVFNIAHNSGTVITGSVTGASASGIGASAAVNGSAHLGALAAALAELRCIEPSLGPEERAPAHALQDEVSATMREVEQPGSTGIPLEQRIIALDEGLKRLTSIGSGVAGAVSGARHLLEPLIEAILRNPA